MKNAKLEKIFFPMGIFFKIWKKGKRIEEQYKTRLRFWLQNRRGKNLSTIFYCDTKEWVLWDEEKKWSTTIHKSKPQLKQS